MPADIAIERPTRFELVFKLLRLRVRSISPSAKLRRADSGTLFGHIAYAIRLSLAANVHSAYITVCAVWLAV